MKYYNLVFVKHQPFGKLFLFQLPMNISVQSKDVGKEVLCQTKRGEQAGTLASESFFIHEKAAKAISEGCGSYWPIANVLGITKKVTTTVTERFPSEAEVYDLRKATQNIANANLPFC